MLVVDPFAPQHLRAARRIACRGAALAGRSGADLDDLKQSAVLGLHGAAEDWDPARAEFSTWLTWRCRCSVRVELRLLRGLPPVARARAAADPEAYDPCADLDDAREAHQQLTAVLRVLETLPHPDRTLFLRHYGAGETCQALADERGVTASAVSERLRKMLAAVQRATCSALGYPLPGPRRSMTRNARRVRRQAAERRAA